MMATDSKGKELNIGDSVLYVNKEPTAFTLRGTVANIVPICMAFGEIQYMVDVKVEFVNKNPVKESIVRVWSGQLVKYDTERTIFV